MQMETKCSLPVGQKLGHLSWVIEVALNILFGAECTGLSTKENTAPWDCDTYWKHR